MQALILAGGRGTRLRPLTLNRPKPIVPLLNIPFLRYQLSLLRQHGVTDVILCVEHLPEAIRQVLGDGRDMGLRLTYVAEAEPLGTGGAVGNAAHLVRERLIVFNGDVLTDVNLTAVVRFHEALGAMATIVMTPVENPTAYGLIETEPEGRIRRFLEKPAADEVRTNTINAGTYVLEPDLLARIPRGAVHSMEREFFPGLIADKIPLYGYSSDAYWLDIGTAEKYLRAHHDLLGRKLLSSAGRWGRLLSDEIWVGEGVEVSPQARYVGPVVIGERASLAPHVHLEAFTVIGAGSVIAPGAAIEGSVLWEDVVVEEGASVVRSILGRGCRIGAHAQLGPGTVLGDGSVVTPYSRLVGER